MGVLSPRNSKLRYVHFRHDFIVVNGPRCTINKLCMRWEASNSPSCGFHFVAVTWVQTGPLSLSLGYACAPCREVHACQIKNDLPVFTCRLDDGSIVEPFSDTLSYHHASFQVYARGAPRV